jgi:hypothetical protein
LYGKIFLTLNLTGLCPENFFLPFFYCPEKNFSTPPSWPEIKILARNKNLLQGIIGFGRAILADTPRIKRG